MRCSRRRRSLRPSAVLAALGVALAAACTPSRGSMLEGEITQAAQTGGRVELAKLYRAPWERVCVLPPGTSPERADSLIGFHFRGAETLNDKGVVGVAFVRGDHIAALARVKQSQADFAPGRTVAYCLPRAEAVFTSTPHPTIAGARVLEPVRPSS